MRLIYALVIRPERHYSLLLFQLFAPANWPTWLIAKLAIIIKVCLLCKWRIFFHQRKYLFFKHITWNCLGRGKNVLQLKNFFGRGHCPRRPHDYATHIDSNFIPTTTINSTDFFHYNASGYTISHHSIPVLIAWYFWKISNYNKEIPTMLIVQQFPDS